MKICLLSDTFPPLSLGGAQSVALRLAQGFHAHGHVVHVVTTCESHAVPLVEDYDFPLTHLKTPYGFKYLKGGVDNIAIAKQLDKIFIDEKIDIIHAHNIHSALGWTWIKYAHRRGIPVVITSHDFMSVSQGKLLPPKKVSYDTAWKSSLFHELKTYRSNLYPLRRKKILKYLNLCQRLVAISENQKRRLHHHGVKNICVIHNGVDLSNKPIQSFLKKPTLMSMGRLTQEKGLNLLLELQKKSTVDFDLVFSGHASHKLKYYGQHYSSRNVIFTGWIDGKEKESWINRAWIGTTLSTYPDPFNLSNLEYMAQGRPVFGTLWGGTPEIVRDHVDGWLTDPRDFDRTHQLLECVLKDPEEIIKKGKNAFERAQSFTWEKSIQAYLKLFDELI